MGEHLTHIDISSLSDYDVPDRLFSEVSQSQDHMRGPIRKLGNPALFNRILGARTSRVAHGFGTRRN